MQKRKYLRRCAGRKELITRVCGLIGLSKGKATTAIFTKKQLLELESYLRNAKDIIEKFHTTHGGDSSNGTTVNRNTTKAAAASR